MKKRLIALVLASCMLAGLLTGCAAAGDAQQNPPPASSDDMPQNETPVTRGEWIQMLASAFALVDPQSDVPYYTDVSAADECFAFVQASVEWGVLRTDEDVFSPQEPVLRRDVAQTAAAAAGFGVSVDEATGAVVSEADEDSLVAFAQEQGIIQAGLDLDGTVTRAECLAAVDAARTTYVTVTASEERMEVVPSSSMVDLTNLGSRLMIDGQRLRITSGASVRENADGSLSALVELDGATVELSAGNVAVTAATASDPSGVAYKISSVQSDGEAVILDTVAPELGDLYDELHVNTTVSANPDDIIWADGVSATPMDGHPGEYQIVLLSGTPQAAPVSALLDRSFSFGNGTEKTWTSQNSSALGTSAGAQAFENSNFVYTDTPSIEDFGGSTDSWTRQLEVQNKFSSGYNISGNITISSIDVSPQIEFNKFWGIPYGIKTASVSVTSNITSSLTLTGNLSNELLIGTVPIPVGPTGLTVSVDLYLYVNASGNLAVRASLTPSAKVEYAAGGFKQSASCTAEAHADMAIDINFGADLQVALRALGMTIVDAGVETGAAVTAQAYVDGNCTVSEENKTVKTVYQQSMNLQADLYYPIITVSVSGLGKSKDWNIISQENAQHVEMMREEWVFWEETVLTENDEVVSNEVAEGDEALAGAADAEKLDLAVYMITLTDEATRQLTVTQGNGDVLWSSDAPVVASVDSNGVVTPLANGTAVITATLANDPDVYVKCVVYVQMQEEHNWEFLPAGMSIVV